MIKNQHKWPLEHWHIELCSKCSLYCPRCSRQEVPEGLHNGELDLEWFEKNFSFELLQNVKKITLCGDDGDPIYAKDMIPIVSYIKKSNPKIQFVIVTNGSYKTGKWWHSLFECLNKNDHIHFSIDGWDNQSNNLYRVNSYWESIMTAVDIAGSYDVYKTWATIAFKFNENKIDDMKEIARGKKFDAFQLTLSSKFGCNYKTYPENDPLQPSSKFVSVGRFTRETDLLTNRVWHDSVSSIHQQRYNKMKSITNKVQPLCFVGNKGLYINAKGRFYPCCWTGLRYQHNKGLFDNIDYSRTLIDVLNDSEWTNLFDSFNEETCPLECKEKCSAKKFTLEHATNW